MAGNKAGGKKAAATNKLRHGADFYSRIGRQGGMNGHTGGTISRRGPAKNKHEDEWDD